MSRNTHFRLSAIGRLALSPLVERELRAGARRPLFYWMRGLLALAAGFQGYELLDRYVMGPPPASGLALMAPPPGSIITGATLLHQMSWLLFLSTLMMCLVSADSITRERREGTLGLLLLTDLTPGEIVWGKMLSCGLTCFLVLLGSLPALMFPVLAGGVTGSEAALIGVGLVNTLFVALTAGLWMSAAFRERRYAVPATLGLVAALAFGPEVLGGSWFGTAAVPFFRLAGLAGWMTAARMPVPYNLVFVPWFITMHAVGWLFLWRASVTLTGGWQDQAHQQVREPEPAEEWPSRAPAPPLLEGHAATPEPAPALARASWLTDPRPWDADPIRWRVERLGSVEGLLWLAVALNFLAQFGTLGSILNFGAAPSDTWGLVSFVGMAVILFSGGLIAWAGARFFQDTPHQQDLELVLTPWVQLAYSGRSMVRVAPGADLAARRGAGSGPARGHFPPLRLRQRLPTGVLVSFAAVPDRREPRPGGGGALLGGHAVWAARAQRNDRCGGDSGTGATAPAGPLGGFDVGLGLAAESLVVAGYGSGEDAARNTCLVVLRGKESGVYHVGEVAPAAG